MKFTFTHSPKKEPKNPIVLTMPLDNYGYRRIIDGVYQRNCSKAMFKKNDQEYRLAWNKLVKWRNIIGWDAYSVSGPPK